MDHPTRHLPDHPTDPATGNAPATRHLEAPRPGPPARCPRCGGEVQGCRIAGPGTADLYVWNPASPPLNWLGGRAEAQVRAHVCLVCGFTEFYSADPGRLRSAP